MARFRRELRRMAEDFVGRELGWQVGPDIDRCVWLVELDGLLWNSPTATSSKLTTHLSSPLCLWRLGHVTQLPIFLSALDRHELELEMVSILGTIIALSRSLGPETGSITSLSPRKTRNGNNAAQVESL